MFARTLNISMTPLFQICKPDNKKTLTKGISSVTTPTQYKY